MAYKLPEMAQAQWRRLGSGASLGVSIRNGCSARRTTQGVSRASGVALVPVSRAMMKTFRMTLAIAALVIGSAPVLILSGVAAAAHQPSQKHLKRSFCLAQCQAEIQAKCIPHHHFHQCRGTLIRQCQHQKPDVCTTSTTTTTITTTTRPGATTTTTMPSHGQAPVPLGSAANFVVLAGSTVTNTGATMVTGDLGVSPGTAVTGFPPGTVTGAMHAGDPAAAQAQIDLTTAFNDAAGRTVGAVTVAGNLGGQTLTPGLYKSTSSLEISSGDLTLDAQGNANAVFIFQMASTLTTTAGRQVILSGGAKAANIVWQVGSSATLGTTSVFQGNILAAQSITLDTGATLDGRALARIAAVALDANTITEPAP
jgi:hypothetical protein